MNLKLSSKIKRVFFFKNSYIFSLEILSKVAHFLETQISFFAPVETVYSRLLAAIAACKVHLLLHFLSLHLARSLRDDSFVHKTSGDRNAEGIYKYVAVALHLARWTFAFSEGRR